MNCAFRLLSIQATCRAAVCTVGLWLAWHAPAAAQREDNQPPRRPASAPIDYATARDSRRLEVTRTRGVIRLDGVLDDEPWVDAPMAHDFNTRMFVNALLQHNTDARQWSSNVRFNIIHRPLSDIFLVYNDRHDERSGNLIDRALVAKMTYLVAF